MVISIRRPAPHRPSTTGAGASSSGGGAAGSTSRAETAPSFAAAMLATSWSSTALYRVGSSPCPARRDASIPRSASTVVRRSVVSSLVTKIWRVLTAWSTSSSVCANFANTSSARMDALPFNVCAMRNNASTESAPSGRSSSARTSDSKRATSSSESDRKSCINAARSMSMTPVPHRPFDPETGDSAPRGSAGSTRLRSFRYHVPGQ